MAATLALAACSAGQSTTLPPPSPSDPSPAGSASRPTIISLFHATHFDGAWKPEHGPNFAQYAAVLRRARSTLVDPAASLFLGNGDDIADFVAGVRTGGRLSVDAFNAAGLDAETYGFDELDFGLDRLADLLPRAAYTYVSANVRDRRTGRVYGETSGAREWLIRDVAGIRVGLTGLISIGARQIATGDIEILEPVTALRETVPSMRAAGAELVVILSHMGNDEALSLAEEVPTIDAILGTHCCNPWPEPEVAGHTIISVPPFGLAAFGRLDLTVRQGKIVEHRLTTYDVSAAAPPDAAVLAVFSRFLRDR